METSVDLRRLKPSVVFDAESVALLGKFGDQLAAYRARKKWIEILRNHFLLEPERDYEVAVNSAGPSGNNQDGTNTDAGNVGGNNSHGLYVVSCLFTSACGRYSFWRLINHQAPDAEQKICQASNAKAIQPDTLLLNSGDPLQNVATRTVPWLLTGLTPKPNQIGKRKRRSTLSRLFETVLRPPRGT